MKKKKKKKNITELAKIKLVECGEVAERNTYSPS